MMLKSRNKWWILFVTTTATSLFLLDTTILPVALPAIEKSLGFSSIGVMWVINAYLLTLTAFLLIGGKLCEVLGFRCAFNIGLSFFGAGALIGALSSTAPVLLLARIIQGVGAALAFPATAALLIATFPPQQRARALGIDTGIASLLMIVGPILG
ncbi:MAG: MFS transporter, partial [Chlamydiales bacterium]